MSLFHQFHKLFMSDIVSFKSCGYLSELVSHPLLDVYFPCFNIPLKQLELIDILLGISGSLFQKGPIDHNVCKVVYLYEVHRTCFG